MPALAFSDQQDLALLAKSNNWLNLGHYKKKLLGGYKSTINGEGFFLAKDGYDNPEAELAETIRQMLEPKTKKTIQCRYLARREMLARLGYLYKEDLVKCAKWDEWIKKLNPQSISLVFASADLESAASSFGHLLLKIHIAKNDNDRELLDYGINFAARTGETQGAEYALKGLFGEFPANYGMAPYHQLIKEYTHLEGRDLWEYKLDLSRDEIERMLMHLQEIEGYYFYYYFLDDNCSRMILKAIEVARPDLVLTGDSRPWSIPIDDLKKIINTQDFVAATKTRISQRTEWNFIYNQLSNAEIKNIKNTIVNSKKSSFGVQPLSTRELEATQYYLSQRPVTEDNLKFRHALNLERSKRTDATKWNAISQDEIERRNPNETHDSSMISFGLGKVEKDDSFFLRFRPGMQGWAELVTNGIGQNEIEIFNFEAIQKSNEGMKLKQFDLITYKVKRPFDRIEGPKSWGFSLGWRDSLYAEGMLGYNFLIYEKINALQGFVAQAQQIGDYRFGTGILFELNVAPVPELSFFGKYKYTFGNSNTANSRTDLAITLRLKKNHEVSLRDETNYVKETRLESTQRMQYVTYKIFF